MDSDPVYLASDAHLGAAPPSMEEAFLRWLRHAGEEASRVFLNGDIFDFWFEWGGVVPTGHTRVLGLLAEIVDSGVPVHLMGGNHDWWGGRYLSDEVGLILHTEEVRMSFAGHDCLIAHGDGLGGGDWGYRMLKRLLRSPSSRRAFRWVHPDITTAIARRVSRTNADAHGVKDNKGRAAALEGWARMRLLQDESLDAVVLGHCHIPNRVEVAQQRFYLNAGDWLHHCTYLVFEEGNAPELRYWIGD